MTQPTAALPKDEVEGFLLAQGFAADPKGKSPFGDLYRKQLDAERHALAYAAKVGNPFAGTSKDDCYESVSFTLDLGGPTHRVVAMGSLRANIAKILAEIDKIRLNPESIRCPKCRSRYVHTKEPRQGDKWRPFLSCDGMEVVGSGQNKRIACSGTLKTMSALIVYRKEDL
jgi:hypothetical protein